MALITCPECGKENVSSLAVSCPDCGFPIKDYYDKIKAEKEQENLVIKEETERTELDKKEVVKPKEEDPKNEIRSETTEKEKKSKTIEDIQNKIEELNKDKRSVLIASCVFLGLTLLCMYYSQVLGGFLTGILLGILGPITFICFKLFFGLLSNLSQSENDLMLAQKSLDLYERAVKKRAIESAKRAEEEKKIYEAQHPICPQCGSRDTKRISTANRAVSVGTLGIASSTIGKQYKCNKCKHMW